VSHSCIWAAQPGFTQAPVRCFQSRGRSP
jgi:hypothetical protein